MKVKFVEWLKNFSPQKQEFIINSLYNLYDISGANISHIVESTKPIYAYIRKYEKLFILHSDDNHIDPMVYESETEALNDLQRIISNAELYENAKKIIIEEELQEPDEDIVISKNLLLKIKTLIEQQTSGLHCEFGACKSTEEYIIDGDMPKEYYDLMDVLLNLPVDNTKTTYDVVGYKNKVQYKSLMGEVIENGIISEADALSLASEKTNQYPFTTVHSSNGELITMVKK